MSQGETRAMFAATRRVSLRLRRASPLSGRTRGSTGEREGGMYMKRRLSLALTLALAAGLLVLVPSVLGSHAIVGPNVEVTDDNNNVDGGIGNVTPSKDAQNRQANETTVAISTVPSPVTGQVGDIVAE